MVKRKRVKDVLLFTLMIALFLHIVLNVAAPWVSPDRLKLDSVVKLKPNATHTYEFTRDQVLQNITISGDVLGLSKLHRAYTIECTTVDTITTTLGLWFEQDNYRTEIQPNTAVAAAVDYEIEVSDLGEPSSVSGVSVWTFDVPTATISLTAANYSSVIILWAQGPILEQFEWFLEKTPMWLGIAGFLFIILSPTMLVVFGRQGEYSNAFVWSIGCFLVGIGLIIGWLWG